MPKGVQYHARGAYLNALGQLITMEMNANSAYLWILPMFHCNGWTFPWAVTAASATHIPLRKIDYDLIWDLLKNHGVSHYCGAPTVQTFLTNNPHKSKLSKEVKVMVAGSPPSPSLIASMQALNLVPVHVYGLTGEFSYPLQCFGDGRGEHMELTFSFVVVRPTPKQKPTAQPPSASLKPTGTTSTPPPNPKKSRARA